MQPPPSRYSLCFRLIALGLWVMPLALVFSDRVDPGLSTVILGPVGNDTRLVLIGLLFLLLPVLAVLLHLAVWVAPGLRRRFRPPWTTHVFALIILALPGLTVWSLMKAPPVVVDAGVPPPSYVAGPVDSSPEANPFQPVSLPPPPHRPAPLPKK